MNLTAIGEKVLDATLVELLPEFNAKMVRIMDAIGYLQKDAKAEKRGNFGGYNYTSARKVLDRVRDECVVEGISVESESDVQEFHIVQSANGGSKSLAAVKTTLYFTDGIFISKAEGLGSGMDSGDKAVMKADTAAIKYACSGKFLISWGDDPEADATTDADVQAAKRESGKQLVQQADTPTDPITLPQDYPDVNALVLDHSGKRGINELRNVVVAAKSKGWTEGKLLEWFKSQGVDLADSELKNSDFVKLNFAMRGA